MIGLLHRNYTVGVSRGVLDFCLPFFAFAVGGLGFEFYVSVVGWRHAFRSGLLLFYCYYYYCTEATNLDVSRGVLGHGSLWRSQDCRDKQDAGHISVQQARGRAAVFPKQLLVKLRRTLHDGAGAQGHNKHHQDPTGAGNPGRARSRPGHLHSSATSTN